MKKIALGLIATGFAITAACGGSGGTTTTQNAGTPAAPAAPTSSGSKAHRGYEAFMKKYDAEMAELEAAFPDTSTPAADPWVKTISGACTPEDASGEGMAVMIMTPVLAKHGHGYVEFKADINKVNADIRAEGLCSSVPPDTSGDAMKAWNAAVDEWNTLTEKRDAAGASTVMVGGRSFEDFKAWATANGKPLTSP